MKGTWEVARKEFIQHFRTKRLLVMILVLIATMALGSIIIPSLIIQEIERFEGEEGFEDDFAFHKDAGNIFSLYLEFPLLGGLVFIQLIAIVLTADAVCSEWQRRTLFLLLSKPVSRSGFVLGKFLGTFGAITTVLVPVLVLDIVAIFLLLERDYLDGQVWRLTQSVLMLVLATGTFVAFAMFTSTLGRSTVMSILTALAGWLLVFPLVGLTGYLIALADDDFQEEGQFDWQAFEEKCGPIVRGGGPVNENAYDEYDKCRRDFEEEQLQWYYERGLAKRDFDAERQACASEAGLAEPGAWENMTEEERQAAEEVNRKCHERIDREQHAWNRQKDEIYMAKWDAPRIDFSRYLSPGNLMTLGSEKAGPALDTFTGGSFFLEGYDNTPARPWLAVIAMFGHIGAWLGFSILTVRRRDFD